MQAFFENISPQASVNRTVVVLGTGGTIAGTAVRQDDVLGYSAAQLGVDVLLRDAIGPGFAGCRLEAEQVSQLDSKDMSVEVWARLAIRIEHHLRRNEVAGVVVTHGTDTIEETAFFLTCVLAPALVAGKPVVLTCAMRPATAINPDGPKNLRDAISVASVGSGGQPQSNGLKGVMVVCAGVIHSPVFVQKVHPTRLDPFESGDGPLLGHVSSDGTVIQAHLTPAESARLDAMHANACVPVTWPVTGDWPRVEIVLNHAGASSTLVDALVDTSLMPGHPHGRPVRAIVVAGTGNGSVHQDLLSSLLRAQSRGIQVVRCSRCLFGSVQAVDDHPLPVISPYSPVKTRIKLMLDLLRTT